ncbi:MAG: DUF2062 domain-containing protein [Gammaproteobacteria bacterium]|jgi:uncharacterized protein (DUF2062 family)|nr:DUF2062 domain-containing protein [Gammaproteobacteria bacterium]
MDWLKKRLVEPLLNLLRQGLAPRDLALCVALGVGVGLFPVLGVSTPALTVLALTLRLNLAAIQLVSYAIAPLQLALIIPFMRLGEIVLGSTPQPMTISAAMELLTEGVLFAIVTLWDAIIHATLGWLLIVPVLIFVSYKILVPILLRLSTTLRSEKP